MKIQKLRLQNFRCFEDTTITFSDQFNVLIGDNGSGKTAVLDALSLSLQHFIKWVTSDKKFLGIASEDIRLEFHPVGELNTAEKQYPVGIEYEGTVAGQKAVWKRRSDSKDDLISSVNLGSDIHVYPATITNTPNSTLQTFQELGASVRRGEKITLPLIAYYGIGRYYDTKQLRGSGIQESEIPEENSRLNGYIDCINPVADGKFLVTRLKTLQAIANERIFQQQSPLQIFEAIKEAIANCMEYTEPQKLDHKLRWMRVQSQ